VQRVEGLQPDRAKREEWVEIVKNNNHLWDCEHMQARRRGGWGAGCRSRAEERFGEWLETADVRGMLCGGQFQRHAYRSSRRDGDSAILLVDRGGLSKLQLIPGDLIKTPDGMYNSPTLADGVEVDGTGRPSAYWIADFDEWGKRKFTRVPANEVVFLSNTTEPLQIRGETCYMQIFDLLSNLDRYVDGVALAAWMATVFGLIIKEETGSKQLGGLPYLTNSQGNQQKAITLENGAVKYVGKAGEVLQVDAKQPLQQTPDFVRMMLRLIGLPFDMPLELVLLDVSQANLSSLRGGMQQYYRACKNRQQRFGTGLSTIYRWWVSREVKAGTFTSEVPDLFWPHAFKGRGWQFTDPVSEVEAAMISIDAGLDSPQNVCATLGRDYDHIQQQLAAAREMRDALKLPDVRSNKTRDAGTPAAPTPPGQQDAPATAA
jgi:capsid protein